MQRAVDGMIANDEDEQDAFYEQNYDDPINQEKLVEEIKYDLDSPYLN